MIVSFGSGVSSQTPDVMLNALHVVDNKERNILFSLYFYISVIQNESGQIIYTYKDELGNFLNFYK